MYFRCLSISVGLFLGVTLSFAEELSFKPIFRLDLSRGFVGVDGQGKTIEATKEGNPLIVEGRSGKALRTGPKGGYLLFPTADIIQTEEGTIEAWICPEDWSMRDGSFHIFFSTVGGNARAVLYKYSEGGTKFYLEYAEKGGTPVGMAAEFDGPAWEAGEWHHLAGTWSAAGIQLYVDGKLVANREERPEMTSGFGEEFRIGDHPEGENPHDNSTLIEDVRIYDKALPSELIEAHFNGEEKDGASISEKQFNVRYTIDRKDSRINVQSVYNGPSVEGLTAKISLKKNDQIVAEAVPAFSQRKIDAALTLGDAKRGDRFLLCLDYVSAKGDVVARQEREISIPSNEWEGNTLGLSDVVPTPWTPLKVSTEKDWTRVSCWGRDYVFTESALPYQIESQGLKMLARPISLTIQSQNKAVAWQASGPLKVVKSTETQVILESQATTSVAGVSFTVTVRTHLEYDGFVFIEMDIPDAGSMLPTGVTLDVAMIPEVARYWHRWNPAWDGSSGVLSEKNGVLDSQTFLPYVWLGDNERGLFWFCESAEYWPNRESADAVQIVRQPSEVVMQFHLQKAGQALKAPWTFQFGLQATPVKSLNPSFRTVQRGIRALWPSTKVASSVKYFGYPEAANPEAFQRRVNEAHGNKITIIPYSILSYLSQGSPEWKWFEDEWYNPLSQDYDTSADVAEYGYDGGIRGVHPGSKSFSDFIIWKNIELMRKFKVDGFYHDNSWVMPSDSAVVGDGWTDEKGVRHATFPVRATRDLYRRLYKAVKEENPNAILISHISGKIWIPHLAYEDGWLLGENLRERLKSSYVDIAPLSSFQAEFSGRQWGLRSFFLPHFTPEVSQQVAPTRELAALLLLHDIAAWPVGSNLAEMERPFKILESFGYDKSHFIPYFAKSPAASSSTPDFYASVYVLDNARRAAVVVANLAKKAQNGTVVFDEKVVGWPVMKASALDAGSAPKIKGQSLSVEIPARDYRIFLIEGPGDGN